LEALQQPIPFSVSDPIWDKLKVYLASKGMKPEPFEHQTDMARFHFAARNTLDLSEVGCAKTAPAIVTLARLFKQGSMKRVLVICRNSAVKNWANEIEHCSDLSSIILRGDKDKRIALLQQAKLSDIYIINYEGLRVIFPYLMAMTWDMILCDEIHAIKSYKGSKRTPTQSYLVRELGKNARSRKGLTGTALTNSIEDVWAIFQFIDPNIFKCNFWGFRNRYMYNANATKSWMRFPDWQARPGAAEEIKKLIAPVVIRFEKREVMKFLPPVLFEQRLVELSPEQRRAINELTRHFITELDDGTEFAALEALTRVGKILQICAGFIYRENEAVYRFPSNPKLTVLKEILDEIGESRAIIWASYKEDIVLINQTLIEMGKEGRFASITGATREDSRQDLIDAFNRNELQYLSCNPNCAGESLTILAPYAIVYSRNHKLGERVQLLGRNDRPGAEQFENLTVIDIVADVPAELRVIAALDSKEDLLKTINPESFRRMLTEGGTNGVKR